MKRVWRRLDSVHQKRINTVTPIEPKIFSRRPSAEEWSVAEIVQHLALVEERVIKDLQKALAKEPQRVGFLKRLIPTLIVASRLVRVKAPAAVNPLDVLDKDTAIETFSAREVLSRSFARRTAQIVSARFFSTIPSWARLMA